jgi:hypothetical protein
VILNPRSVSYADLRQEAEDSEKMIVRVAFISDSIEQGHLVNPNDYLLEDASIPRKHNRGGRRYSDVRRPLESNHEVSEAQTSDTVVDAPSSIPLRGRSTTPDPPAAVQSKGGYRYTPAEMTYIWAVIRRIITRDRQANKLTVIKALHKKVCRVCDSIFAVLATQRHRLKMPHHSLSSWSSMLNRQREMYEAVRAEALLSTPTSGAPPPNVQTHQGAHHARNDSSDAEMNETRREAELLEELQVGASLIPAEGESMQDDEHEQFSPAGANEDGIELDAYTQDFEALVGFLVSADADAADEYEIFERLAAKVVLIRDVFL